MRKPHFKIYPLNPKHWKIKIFCWIMRYFSYCLFHNTFMEREVENVSIQQLVIHDHFRILFKGGQKNQDGHNGAIKAEPVPCLSHTLKHNFVMLWPLPWLFLTMLYCADTFNFCCSVMLFISPQPFPLGGEGIPLLQK